MVQGTKGSLEQIRSHSSLASSALLEDPVKLRSVVSISTRASPSIKELKQYQTSKEAPRDFKILFKRDFFPRQWNCEIAGLCCSFICVIAILVLLLSLDGTLLSAWTLFITPNTAISTLSTISRASMIFTVTQCVSQLKWHHFKSPHLLKDFETFDSASRGPGGALWLLWSLRSHAYLAYVGAIIIIAFIAIDPFAQELIIFLSEVAPFPNITSWLGRSHIYDPPMPSDAMFVGTCQSLGPMNNTNNDSGWFTFSNSRGIYVGHLSVSSQPGISMQFYRVCMVRAWDTRSLQ